ncbi:MAG: hypothetical protein ACK5KP_07455 [Paludibacteraceae bacterium]
MTQLSKLIKLLLVVLIILVSQRMTAGDFKNSRYNHRILSINSGYTFSGYGDCWGVNSEISHFKSFFPWLFHRESLDGWIVNGSSWQDIGYENQTGVSLTAEIGIVPFKTGERIFYLSGGGTLGYLSIIRPWASGTRYFTNSDGTTQTMTNISYGADNYFSPGFSISAGYTTRVNSKLYLNIRAQTKAYASGDFVSTLSVGIGLNALKK